MGGRQTSRSVAKVAFNTGAYLLMAGAILFLGTGIVFIRSDLADIASEAGMIEDFNARARSEAEAERQDSPDKTGANNSVLTFWKKQNLWDQ